MESTSTSSTNDGEASTMTIDQIGTVLSSTPPIVEHILQNVSSMHQLNRCASVCRLWHKVAQAIKRGRTNIIRLFVAYKEKNYDEHLTTCSEICIAKRRFDIGEHFYNIMSKATSEPRLALLFASDKIFNKPQRFFRNFKLYPDERTVYGKRRRLNQTDDCALDDRSVYGVPLIDFLKHYLPRKCQVIGCGALGIIGTSTDNSISLEVESSPGLTAVFFPSLPDVEIYQFKMYASHEEAFRESKHIGSTFINKLTGIPEDKHIECLLTFFHDVPENIVSAQVIIQHYLQEENYRMALGGAVVDDLAVPLSTPYDEWPMCVGLAFTGKYIKAASIILEQNLKTKEEVLEKLKKLKECNIPEDNALAFMFACCGRGSLFYEASNVETEMFRKVFPKVPLIGVFGGGEIGVEFLPHYKRSEEKSFPHENINPHGKYKWFHEYTTIIVLISLGKFYKE